MQFLGAPFPLYVGKRRQFDLFRHMYRFCWGLGGVGGAMIGGTCAWFS